LQEGHCLRDHALLACRRSGQSRQSSPSATMPTLIQLINEGLGFTLLPQMAVEAGLTVGTRIVTRPLAGGEAKRIIALAWRPHCPRAQEFTLLSAKMRAIHQSPMENSPCIASSSATLSIRKNRSA
jgi:LysR family hydrogen peroxide-inducible transcriptional activator